MCQVEEEYHEQLELFLSAVSASKKCVKCKEELAAVVIRAGDSYCSCGSLPAEWRQRQRWKG
uniref:Uncharacterized protein n=1 Tax=Xiphophorus couchianus TaxID=32473 RepID=A0A3B5M5X1_9TELE